MGKKLIGKWQKSCTILEVFTKDGVFYTRESEIIDENMQETSPSEEFDEEGATLKDVLEFYGMSDAEKIR